MLPIQRSEFELPESGFENEKCDPTSTQIVCPGVGETFESNSTAEMVGAEYPSPPPTTEKLNAT